jgi:23S rRNA G2445 N2-methylase RlmL
MKIAATLPGLEKITEKETKGKKYIDTKVIYNKKLKLKSALYWYTLIKKFKFKKEKEIYSKIKKIKVEEPIKIECMRKGEHNFNSQDIRHNLSKRFKTDYKAPRGTLVVDIKDNNCFIGKELESYKRFYKIRTSRNSLNPIISYSLLKIAGLKKTDSLLDPFCSDGSILIEAGLLGCKKLFGFEKDIKNASINSKVAKLKIELRTDSIDWLDTIFKKNSVDFIISNPPFISKRSDREEVEKSIKELFHQASYILKKKMVLISSKSELLEKYSKEYKFSMKQEAEIKVGDNLYKVFAFKK